MCAASPLRTILVLFSVLGISACACQSDSSPSSPWGQLGRAKAVYLVTTENPIELEAYRVKCPVKRLEIVPISMISLRIREIGEEPIIFLINRGRRLRCSEEDERLLPYATAAIKPNAVLTYMAKTKKRDLRREGSWDVLISAPSAKWLFKTFDQFLTSRTIPNPPVVQEISSVAVVATGGRETALRWIKPVEQSTDWEFYDAAKLEESTSFIGFDEVYLINRDACPELPAHVIARLPSGIRAELAKNGSIADILVEKERKVEDDRQGWRAAIIAPSQRFLDMQIQRFGRMDRVPESLYTESLKDLTGFKSIAVAARSADRNRTDFEPYLDEIASRVTSALSNNTRFRCANRQDMKEAIYEALKTGQRVELDPLKAEGLGAAVDSHLLVVVDLLDVSTLSTFKANDPVQMTSGYGSFIEPPPAKPRQPQLSDRRYGFLGPRKYRGYDDPKYRSDMAEYREEYREWQHAYNRWLARKYEHEQRIYSRDIEWRVSCDVTESATVSANVRVYSLEQIPGQYAPGVVVFSCPLSGSYQKTRLHKEDIVVVRGEGRRPGMIKVPPSDSFISDTSIIAEAIERAAASFIGNMHSAALLPGDLVNLRPVTALKEPAPTEIVPVSLSPEPVENADTSAVLVKLKDTVEYEETGSVDYPHEPKKDTEIQSLEKRAVESACGKILTRVLMENPESELTLSDVINNVEILSAGWNPEAKEYRVKVRYSASS